MNIKFENNKMFVESDYNVVFVKKAKELHGIWKSPYWVFNEEDEKHVRKTLLDVFGEDGSYCETVTVDIDLDTFEHTDEIMLKNLVIATRRYRDRDVVLSKNAIVVKGEFLKSGGSAKYPSVTYTPGTVIRVKKLPLLIFDEVKETKGIYISELNNSQKKEELERELKLLKEKIIEIEEQLNKL